MSNKTSHRGPKLVNYCYSRVLVMHYGIFRLRAALICAHSTCRKVESVCEHTVVTHC